MRDLRLKKQKQNFAENNKTIVSTTVSSQQSAAPVQEKVQLTEQEKRIAAAMGLSESEYAKWK